MRYYNIRQEIIKTYPQKCSDFHNNEAKKAKAHAVAVIIKQLRELATTESLTYFIKYISQRSVC